MEAKEEEKEEGRCHIQVTIYLASANPSVEKEESDEDMGFGLFD